MAKSTKASTFHYIFLIGIALLPLLQISTLQDETLLSRWLWVDAFSLITFLSIYKKSTQITLPVWPLALLSALVLSLIAAVFAAHNRSEALGVLARYLSFLPLLVLFLSALRLKIIDAKLVFKGAVIFGGLSALPTLFQLLQAIGSGDFFSDIYTITGTFSHKNLLASALMLSFPFVLGAWAALKGIWSRAAMILAFLMVIEIFVLRTRGVWLGLIGASLIAFIFVKISAAKELRINRRWSLIISGLSLLILVGLFLSPQIKAGFTNSSNVQKRLVFWGNTLEMIKEQPLSGVGLGNWRLFFPKYGLNEVGENARQGITHIQRPHNDYLWLWSEAGPLALILLLALYLLAFRQAYLNLKESEDSGAYLQLAALFALSAYAIFSFGDFPIERAPHTFWWMLSLAILFAPMRGRWPARIPSMLALFALVYAGFVNLQRYQAEQGMEAVLQANSSQDARAIVSAAEEVYSDWYTVDNYANPIQYYASKGYLFTQRPQQSYEALEIAFEDAPYNILIYELMAQYQARQGSVEKAIAYADSGLQISPQFKVLILLKAELHIQRQEFALALEALNMHEPRSQSKRYLQDLATALRGSLNTYPEHGRFPEMMEHLKQSGNLNRPEDYIRAYRIKRGIQ